jgi:predicted secreted protein
MKSKFDKRCVLKKGIQTLSLTLTLTLLLLACQKENIDTTIRAAEGSSFNIQLRANRTAGYHWKWINRDEVTIADTTGLEFIIDNPDLEGSPGTEVWTFKGKIKGEETLSFVYQGPGDTGNEGDKNKNISLIIY